MLYAARKHMAEAIVLGKGLNIEGGNYEVADRECAAHGCLFPLPIPPVMPILIMLLLRKFDLDGRLDRKDFQVGYVGGDDVLKREGRDVSKRRPDAPTA